MTLGAVQDRWWIVWSFVALIAAGCAPRASHVAQKHDAVVASSSPSVSTASIAPTVSTAPSPDRSLSPEAYVLQGIPASDRLWSRYEYARAAVALDALAKRDPGLLPRLRSATSGVVFARMVELGNLESETPLDAGAGAAIVEASGSMLRTYLAAHRAAPSFAHELALLQAFTVAVSARLTAVVMKLERPKAEAAASEFDRGRGQVISGLSTIIDGLLTSLAERTIYDSGDRAVMAGSFERDGLAIVGALPHLTQLELCGRLERVALNEPFGDVKAVLLRAGRACLPH